MCILTPEERCDIIKQIQYLHNEAMGVQSAFLGSIALPVGVFALIIYYALESKQPSTLFVILPFLFSLSTFNLLKYSIKILGLDAYIRHLECLLNESYQKPLFLWQSHLVYVNGYSFVGGLVQIPSFFAILIFLLYKFYQYLPECDWFDNAATIMTCLLITQGISLFIALLVCLLQYHAVLDGCQRIFTAWDKNEKIFYTPPPTTFNLKRLYVLVKLDNFRAKQKAKKKIFKK